jgi:formate hydrogenlyase subunit 4
MRLAVFLGLLVTLFTPWGVATSAAPLALAAGTAAFAAKVAAAGVALAAGEVFMAKLRLFRVPELLGGSFLLALMAVAASVFLGAA